MCLQTASKRLVMVFKPVKNLFTSHSVHPEGPLAIHGEPMEISVMLENTIKIPITFSDISLLWTFQKTPDEACISNEVLFKEGEPVNVDLRSRIDEIVWATKVDQLTINEHECQTVTFKVTPKAVGKIVITGIVGQLAAQNDKESLWGKLEFEPLVIRPTGPQQTEKPKVYDKRREVEVLDAAPAMVISFSEIPLEVLAGELIPITMQYTNCGVGEITDLYMAFEHPRNFLTESSSSSELPLSLLRDFKDLTNLNLSRDKETRKQYINCIFDTSKGDQPMQRNETRSCRLWLQVPYKKGAIEMRVLAYYSLPVQYTKLKYRLIRHSWNLTVIESLALEANCNVTNVQTGHIGLDVVVRNLNQIHHPVAIEVMLNELLLFCPKYDLQPDDMVHFKSPGSGRIFDQNQLLTATELLGFRCGLQARDGGVSKSNEIQFITSQISNLNIQSPLDDKGALAGTTTNSFLMKEETKYLRVFGQTSNNEEFNQIVATPDQHMTLVLNWSATVKGNNAMPQRTAHGQHFVQMRHLYESSYCPRSSEQNTTKSFTHDENSFSIYDFSAAMSAQKEYAMVSGDWAVQNM